MYSIKRSFHGRKFSLYYIHPKEELMKKAIAALKSRGRRYRLLDDGYTYYLYSG